MMAKCKVFGNQFAAKRYNHGICSDDCRDKQAQKKSVARIKKTCRLCLVEFETNRTDKDFCCAEHRIAYNNFSKSKASTLFSASIDWRGMKGRPRKHDGQQRFSQAFAMAREDFYEFQKPYIDAVKDDIGDAE